MTQPDRNLDDARQALAMVRMAQRKGAAFATYSNAGPLIAIWGAVWMGANLVSFLVPAWSNLAWLTGIAIGISASVIGGLKHRHREPQQHYALSSVLTAMVIAAGIAAVLTVADIQNAKQANAVISLLVALAYALAGAWRGLWLLALGAAMAGAVLTGWFLFYDWFELWMGLAGGGVLMFTGLWLRRM